MSNQEPSPIQDLTREHSDRATRAKRFGLALIAGVIVALMAWPDLRPTPSLWAQQSPLTPTLTVTGTPTLLFTPTNTPTKELRVVNEIRSPVSGDAIARTVQIIGTALIPNFSSYDIHISPAAMEDWTWLTSSIQVVHDDTLYLFDTTAFPDGFYDLRVRAIDIYGSYTESYALNVEIRNANPPTPTPPPGATSPPVSPLFLPTPTPTPDERRQGPEGQGFFAPDAGTVVRGLVDIVATVNGYPENPFQRYELHIARAGHIDWLWLAGGETQVWQAPIHQWDTTQFEDGLYDLRLRIVFRDSNYNEFYLRNLSVANDGPPQLALAPPVGLTSPRSGDAVSGIVEFRGVVPADDLLRWELYWSPGTYEAWQFLVSSPDPANGLLARVDLSQLPSGLYDFRLRIVHSDTNYTDSYARDLRLLPTEPTQQPIQPSKKSKHDKPKWSE